MLWLMTLTSSTCVRPGDGDVRDDLAPDFALHVVHGQARREEVTQFDLVAIGVVGQRDFVYTFGENLTATSTSINVLCHGQYISKPPPRVSLAWWGWEMVRNSCGLWLWRDALGDWRGPGRLLGSLLICADYKPVRRLQHPAHPLRSR